MSVFKVITGASSSYQGEDAEKKYHDTDAIQDVIAYVLNPAKTHPSYIGGFSVNPQMAAAQFEIVARVNGKAFGIRLRHMVLSFEPGEPVSKDLAKQIAYQVAAYYGDEYQIIYAVHLDKPHLHIHFVMNTVSYRTGTKYDGSKRDYYRFIDHMKNVLRGYGFYLTVQTT